MPYLIRVPLRPVCLSANCTNNSATLVMYDLTTLFGNAICLTPARRRKLCRSCRTCAEIKPRFLKPPVQSLIKASRPWDRLSLDFKGPVRGKCPYLLVAVDEYSRFPFVRPCKNVKSSTVIVFSVLRFWFSLLHPLRSRLTVCQLRDADFPFRSWHFFQHVHCLPSDWEQPVRTV